MIRHVVGFQLKPEATADQIATLLGALRGMPAEIAEIRSLSVGPNLTDRDTPCRYVLSSTFDDMAALRRYLVHPAHLRVVALALTPIQAAPSLIFDVEE